MSSHTTNFKLLNKSEFIYKGKQYDIIKSTIKDNVTYYYCLNDKSEEKLFFKPGKSCE